MQRGKKKKRSCPPHRKVIATAMSSPGWSWSCAPGYSPCRRLHRHLHTVKTQAHCWKTALCLFLSQGRGILWSQHVIFRTDTIFLVIIITFSARTVLSAHVNAASAGLNNKGNALFHCTKWNNSNQENLDKSLIRKTDSICNISPFSPCINPFAINLPPLKKPAFLTKPTQGSHYFNQLEGFNTLLIFRRIEKAPVLSPGCLFFLYMTFRYLWKIIPIMKSAIYCFKVQSVVTLESTCSWILLVGLCAQESAERKDFNQRAIAWNLLRNSYLSPLDFLLFKSTADTLWNETAISPT